MPKIDRTADEYPSEEMLLAAFERAELHKRSDKPGVVFGSVVDHLGLPRGSWTTRRLRPKLDALEAGGYVERFRQHSSTVWTLTPSGRKWLATVRRTGEIDGLPESPQHKEWRKARDAAATRISGFRRDVHVALKEARSLIDTGRQPSEAWFQTSERLHHACWRLGSAIYCLGEWAEPDDSTPDIDQHPTEAQHGRRDLHMWDRD